jgi:hypothetical protein
MAQKKKASVKLNLRLEAAIHEKLVKAAEKNLRSLQTEILYRLEQTLDPVWIPDEVEKAIVMTADAIGREMEERGSATKTFFERQAKKRA